jgi:hypothetical protein
MQNVYSINNFGFLMLSNQSCGLQNSSGIIHKPEVELPADTEGVLDCGCLYYCAWRLAGQLGLSSFYFCPSPLKCHHANILGFLGGFLNLKKKKLNKKLSESEFDCFVQYSSILSIAVCKFATN